MVRLDPEDWMRAQSEPGARPFTHGGRPMTGFLLVDPEGTTDDASLRDWVRRGVAQGRALPPKKGSS